ncbi:hypothetical protein Mal52_13260 [Symmachiella dynata]|uniref:Uncharacterized protein n=1 Tax=Symmachiella dynata TaxID=2527995 RepID=A0A517ZK76_9PLAN|nr:hypothetical protein [Symmachiella dynata]QDU42857.1 hypothetical protein Mal52_13260 [Symmachiella dynata]
MLLVNLSGTPPTHTPTPWIIDGSTIRDQEHHAIVELAGDNLPPKQVAANASLIATAPILLELAHDYEATCVDRLGLLREEEYQWRDPAELRHMIGHWTVQLEDVRQVIAQAQGVKDA